ncbi:hypothetical protein GCM10025762_20480 [Haloechinothrix salitolerans]
MGSRVQSPVPHRHRTVRRRLRHGLAVLFAALVAVGTPAATGVATAQDNPYERGPDPTESSIEAPRGPFDVDETSVSSWVSGFGGGTIYYPTDTR